MTAAETRRRPRSQAAALLSMALLVTGCAVGAPAATGDGRPTPRGTTADARRDALETDARERGDATPPTSATRVDDGRVPASGVLRTASGILVPIRFTTADGSWVVGTPCGNETTIDDGTPVDPVQVLLDPGHGGKAESGTIGPNRLWEAPLNLDVAKRTERWLEAQGVTVELTRRDDRQVDLLARGELAVALQPTVFVSVHHNGGHARSSDAPGTMAFHQIDNADSTRLAGLLFEEVSTAMATLDLDWVAGPAPGAMAVRNERGTDYYGVLRSSPGVPAVIIEGVYLTGAREADALNLPEVRELEAAAIGTAILRYLTTSAPGTGYQPEWAFDADSLPDHEPETCTDPLLG